MRGSHRSPVNSPHKGQWRGALKFSLIWINGVVNNRWAGDLRRQSTHYDITVMLFWECVQYPLSVRESCGKLRLTNVVLDQRTGKQIYSLNYGRREIIPEINFKVLVAKVKYFLLSLYFSKLTRTGYNPLRQAFGMNHGHFSPLRYAGLETCGYKRDHQVLTISTISHCYHRTKLILSIFVSSGLSISVSLSMHRYWHHFVKLI